MSVQDYKPMNTAPLDGTVVLVLAGSRKPRAAYWDSKDNKWCYWHAVKEPCYPVYWTPLPADPPSDYMPEIKTLEDEETFQKEVAHGLAMDKIVEAGISKAAAPPKAKAKTESVKAEAKEPETKAPYISKFEAPKTAKK